MIRSSALAIRSVFHRRRWTCQVPRRKAVMGMMAGFGVSESRSGCSWEDRYPRG